MIKHIQIDPNGLCNAKCWFCPVAYEGNPKKGRTNMSIETLDNILKQISDGIGDFVSKDKLIGYTAHYNEVILHPDFEKIIQTYEKYNIQMFLFSNGIALTPDKIDIINKYSESIYRITLNIPSSNREQWAKFVGVNIKLYDKVISNLQYAHTTMNKIIKDNKIAIVVNGITEQSNPEMGGWTIALDNSKQENFSMFSGDVSKTIQDFSIMFPNFGIGNNIALEDRAGILSDLNVLSNKQAIDKNKKTKVIGCYDNRIDEWIHISASGDVFICCEDFYFTTSFGNIHEKTIKEIWYSKQHQDMINKSMSDLCTKCSYAIWSN